MGSIVQDESSVVCSGVSGRKFGEGKWEQRGYVWEGKGRLSLCLMLVSVFVSACLGCGCFCCLVVQPAVSRVLDVFNMPFDLSEEQLWEAFLPFEGLADVVRLQRDKSFSIVQLYFLDAKSAMNAKMQLDGFRLFPRGRRLNVDYNYRTKWAFEMGNNWEHLKSMGWYEFVISKEFAEEVKASNDSSAENDSLSVVDALKCSEIFVDQNEDTASTNAQTTTISK